MNKKELKTYLDNKINSNEIENAILFYGENIEEFEKEILLFCYYIINSNAEVKENNSQNEKKKQIKEQQKENSKIEILKKLYQTGKFYTIYDQDVEINLFYNKEKLNKEKKENVKNNKKNDNIKLEADSDIDENAIIKQMLNARENSKIKLKNIKNMFDNISESSIDENRIYYILDADRLNVQSQNAILKTLEEPPKNTYIFLLAHSIDEILPTIKSRCSKIYLAEMSEIYSKKELKKELELLQDNDILNIFSDAKKYSYSVFFQKYKEIIKQDKISEYVNILENIFAKNIIENINLKSAYRPILKAKEDLNYNGNKRIIKLELITGLYNSINSKQRCYDDLRYMYR